jgi:hypothetical protein
LSKNSICLRKTISFAFENPIRPTNLLHRIFAVACAALTIKLIAASTSMKANANFARKKLLDGCDTMESSLRGLHDTKGRIAEEIHSIRKLGKSLRGGFALFKLGKSSSKDIQAIGRLLSAPRDAVSRLSTWRKLAWEDDGAAAAIEALLEQHTHSAARKLPLETLSWCLGRVEAARKNLLDLPQDCLDTQIEKGLRKLSKRATKRCRLLAHRGDDAFHDARKALKAYLGAIAFLPEGLVSLAPEWREIPELLGDENDLATLSLWLQSHGFTERLVPLLWIRLEARRQRLRNQVIDEVSHLHPPDAP